MVEIYASIIAKKMLTNADPGYVDLTSPAGIGIGALVYSYDGDIYAVLYHRGVVHYLHGAAGGNRADQRAP